MISANVGQQSQLDLEKIMVVLKLIINLFGSYATMASLTVVLWPNYNLFPMKA